MRIYAGENGRYLTHILLIPGGWEWGEMRVEDGEEEGEREWRKEENLESDWEGRKSKYQKKKLRGKGRSVEQIGTEKKNEWEGYE